MVDCPKFLDAYRILGGRSKTLNTTNCCTWNTNIVWCEKDRITQLALMNHNLNGTLPREFESFTKLTALSLRNNQLKGRIPNSWSTIQFEILDLDHNMLSGRLPDLDLRGEKYDFSSNQFYGPIPSSWPVSRFYGGKEDAQSCSFAGTKTCLRSNLTRANLCDMSLCTEQVHSVLSLPAIGPTTSMDPPAASISTAGNIVMGVGFVIISVAAGIGCVTYFYRKMNIKFNLRKSVPPP